jgi:hypothetical protein
MFQRTICISCSKLFLFRVLWDRNPRSSFIHFILQQYPRSTCPRISIILFMLCPLASKRITQPSKHAPLSSKQTHPSLNSPKIPITSLLSHPQNSPIRPPTRRAIPPDIEPKSETRRHRFTARPHRAKLSRAIPHLRFTSVITSKNGACLESYTTNTCLIDTTPANHPTSALTVLAHVSRPA